MDYGIESEGSNLSGVSSHCSWEEPGDGDNRSSHSNEEDKENRLLEEHRRGSGELDRPHISEYGRLNNLL